MSSYPPQPKVRVAVFGSFYRGFHVLSEMLKGSIATQVQVVGVATDDVSSSFVSRERRVWSYPHTQIEEVMVEQLAVAHHVPIYKGRVKTDEFYDIYENNWRPDVCISATFGQRINARLFQYPPMGFYNLHPCINDGWPSHYAGPNPFQALLKDESDHAVIAMHEVDDGFDTGKLVALSEKIYFPPDASVIDLHKASSPLAAKFFAQELAKLLASCEMDFATE
ncbi:formyltransferase family protein [Noviherbaspirillum sp. Root189]|uniref:formyltransferase family protein n=1 Tax=Noviherbaspirillum sp. Root189 TaxID=1736487 RepID=UPI00070FA04D|nr:formyltransferase family protein [Noviherbaspirillum sp. Root189]KRB67897.1 formyl transferase N-terminal domain-containing protein [Noviherbaspirillum sp. Root189]